MSLKQEQGETDKEIDVRLKKCWPKWPGLPEGRTFVRSGDKVKKGDWFHGETAYIIFHDPPIKDNLSWKKSITPNLIYTRSLSNVILDHTAQEEKIQNDLVNHPSHYTSHPSGIEAIQVCEHMSFCLGNAMKYIWRSGQKGSQVQDLQKAIWYINREIQRLQK